MNEQQQPQYYEEDEIHLIDLIYPLVKRRRFLGAFCFLALLLAGLYVYMTPKTYSATAVILPQVKDQGTGGELKAALVQQFGLSGLDTSSTAAPSEVFESILKSKHLAREVMKRSGYDFYMRKRLADNRHVEAFLNNLNISKESTQPTISITVESHEPSVASDLANTYLEELDRFNRENTVTSAQRLRQYIEGRLQAAEQELEEAQQELRDFQERHRAISISKQAEATLQVLSELESRRVELEVEKAAKMRFYKGPHMEIEQLEARMQAIQKNIDRLTYSEEPRVEVEREKGKVEFYIPLSQIPSLNFDESKLLLKVKAKTQVVTMLTTQLEQAKLDEARDMPTINVLDWAPSPDEPTKPKPKLILLLSLLLAVFLGVFLIFIMEFAQRLSEDPEHSGKWQEIKGAFHPFRSRKNKPRQNSE